MNRLTNINGPCGCSYAVRVGPGNSAVDGVNFQAATGTLVFESTQTSARIAITVYSNDGYSNSDVTFLVELSGAVNATLGSRITATVALRNVHPPAPTAPFQTASTPTAVNVSWGTPLWPNPPEGDAGQVSFMCCSVCLQTCVFLCCMRWECLHTHASPT